MISIRYDPKISAKAVATLRIPSNSPSTPNTITLDPPAAGRSRVAPGVACARTLVQRGRLTLTCKLTRTGAPGRCQLTVWLQRKGRTVAFGSSAPSRKPTLRVRLRLRHGLARGRYVLAIAVTNPTLTLAEGPGASLNDAWNHTP